MNTAYLLIGSNMGDRLNVLHNAKAGIEKTCGAVVQTSSIYLTAAWGLQEQNDFLNQVLKVETVLGAQPLLRAVLHLEDILGRKREVRYGPRTIDIDILFFNDAVIKEEALLIPHPQLQNRRFVLVPLAEIAPELEHPVFKKNVLQLLAECADTLAVQKFQ